MSGIPSWAFVGAKVVFVGSPKIGPTPESLGFNIEVRPVAKEVYTIREVRSAHGDITGKVGVGIRLVELFVSGRWPDGHRFYDAWAALNGFRPLITESDDLEAHFNELLNTRVTERERA